MPHSLPVKNLPCGSSSVFTLLFSPLSISLCLTTYPLSLHLSFKNSLWLFFIVLYNIFIQKISSRELENENYENDTYLNIESSDYDFGQETVDLRAKDFRDQDKESLELVSGYDIVKS
ncbi:hypothetical protein AMTRI_Chr12g240620 [Amborella trichopoda]